MSYVPASREKKEACMRRPDARQPGDRRPRALARWLLAAIILALLPLAGLPPATPASAGINTWTSSGPYFAHAKALAINPQNPATIYLGTADGLFKSSDGGGNWSDSGQGLYYRNVNALAIDPSNPNILYAGLNGSSSAPSLFRSIDGGTNWTAIKNGLVDSCGCPEITALAVDPRNPAVVYVGTLLGLYKSINRGDSWSEAGLVDIAINALVIDPRDSATLYAGVSGGIYKSTDGAASWMPVGLSGIYVTSLAIDPANPRILYAGQGSSNPTSNPISIYKSVDSGATWTPSGNGILCCAVVSALAIDPRAPATIYAGTNIGVFKSVDAGANWAAARGGLGDADVAALAIDPSNPATLYAAAFEGVYKSVNGAAGWFSINAGLPKVSVSALVIDPRNPATLYAAGFEGVYKSTNAAASWRLASTGVSNLSDLVIDPQAGTLYAATYGGVFKSSDGALSWQPSGSTILSGYIVLEIDPQNPNTLYAAGGNQIYQSLDGAASWSLRGIVALPQGDYLTRLELDPHNPSILQVLTFDGGLLRSIDGGMSWSQTGSGIWTMAVDPIIPARLFYTTYTNQLYQSLNGGASWSLVGPLPPGPPSPNTCAGFAPYSLAVDSMIPNTLYVGYAGYGACASSARGVAPTASAGVNIYRSIDGGRSWSPFNSGMPANLGISELVPDPASPGRVYAAAFEGVYSISVPTLRLFVSDPLIGGTNVPIGAPPFAVQRTPAQNNTFDIVVTAFGANSIATGFTGPISLKLAAGAGPLLGALTTNAVNGVARFRGLSLSTLGRGYRLMATSPGVANGSDAPFEVLEPEVEPNGTIESATPLALDTAGRAARTGWVAVSDDADLFVLNTPRTGATVAITLSNLPADYDLALLADPRNAISGSDGVGLFNVADAGSADAQGRAVSLTQSDSLARISSLAGLISATGHHRDLSGSVLALSTRRTGDETITARLGPGGNYYLLVYSGAGAADAVRPYRLDLSLSGGIIPPAPPPTATPAGLNLTRDPAVRTIFLYNSARMRARYASSAELAAVEQIVTALTPGPNNGLMQASGGTSIDLSNAKNQLPTAVAGSLANLYAAWDQAAHRPMPSYANQVAQQIRAILNRAITSYYTGTTDIVLIGGDEIIPFYRAPDETAIAPESDYYRELLTTNALSTTAPLAGSLGGNFVQTDDFYADREPTLWRGRALYIPDLGIGRLVERPTDIVRYLNAYAGSDYTIAADQTADPRAGRKAGAALVTGYDYVIDQANAIRDQLVTYGFPDHGRNTATLGVTYTLNLLNDPALDQHTWKLGDFTNLWLSGPRSRYQLASLNGHFNHYTLAPSDTSGGVLTASQLESLSSAYFADALIYSVGCHAGLSLTPESFNAGAPNAAQLQADFARAIVQQGGNWMSNTGFAYGDKDTIGYSERLALLFTQEIGRKAMNGDIYEGATIGESLARAKQRYFRAMGPSGFGVGDEKTLIQMTLYGLPFMKVRVPKPVVPPYGDSFDPPDQPIPQSLQQNNGLLTRVITITNQFSFAPASDDGQVPRVISKVFDSYTGATTVLTSADQMALGRPVLPALTFDITLRANPATCGQDCAIPQPAGVRLRSATTLPDQSDFKPHVTRPITEQVYAQERSDPAMSFLETWLPEVPYTFQRTAAFDSGERHYLDKLIVSPAQFNAAGPDRGTLRRFSQMVFEVSYLDPPSAAKRNPTVLWCFLGWGDCSKPPEDGGGRGHGRLVTIQAAADTIELSSTVTYSTSIGMRQVSATYTIDGIHWQRQVLGLEKIVTTRPDGTTTARYTADVPAPPPTGNIAVFFETIDNAGWVWVSSLKGTNGAFTKRFLPVVSFPRVPDLVGSIRLSPDKRAFKAGEPVQIIVTITNAGTGDAGPFWVDLFINPSAPPTAANQIWNNACKMTPCFGIAWQVPGGLQAGHSTTLTSDTLVPPGYSVWPGWFASGTTDLYLYVDSWNPGVVSGAVAESNESNNQFHLGGLTVTGANPAFLAMPDGRRHLARPAP
jgi:Peptidase family C25